MIGPGEFVDQLFDNPQETILLDGSKFLRCTFKDCTVSYSGSSAEMAGCKFMGEVVVVLGGAASRTVRFLAAGGLVRVGGEVDREDGRIRVLHEEEAS